MRTDWTDKTLKAFADENDEIDMAAQAIELLAALVHKNEKWRSVWRSAAAAVTEGVDCCPKCYVMAPIPCSCVVSTEDDPTPDHGDSEWCTG